MPKTLRKRFDLPGITFANATAKETYELEKHTTRLTGLLLTADRDDMLFHRGTVQILINGEEVIPDNYHAKLLMSGLGVSPKDRYLPLDLPPGNGIVKVSYQDSDNPSMPFAPYNVSVYLQTEIEDETD